MLPDNARTETKRGNMPKTENVKKKPRRKNTRTSRGEGFCLALGQVIRGIRNAMGLTQEAFAAKVGLDQTTIAKAETGVHFGRIDTWLQISEAIEMPIDTIFKKAADIVGKVPSTRRSEMMARIIEALEREEQRLVKLYRASNEKGKRQFADVAASIQAAH